MKKLWIILGSIFLIIVMSFLWFKGGYNKAIAKDEEVKSAWAQVDNQLQRRNDLIPNLISTVKGFASHEKEIFTEVTRLRSQWGKSASVGEKVENANAMSGALSRLLLVSERQFACDQVSAAGDPRQSVIWRPRVPQRRRLKAKISSNRSFRFSAWSKAVRVAARFC